MAGDDAAADLEVEAFRRLYPSQFYERYLEAGVRPDGRPLGRARATSIAIGAVQTADGSALVKLGNTTMLAAVKLEVMVPYPEAPEDGKIALMHLELPAVLVTEDGKVLPHPSEVSGNKNHLDEDQKMADCQEDQGKLHSRGARGLQLGAIPVALTCALHKRQLLADPCAEEEFILQTALTVILNLSGGLISLYKPGGATLATTATVQDCIALAKARAKEVKKILDGAFSP